MSRPLKFHHVNLLFAKVNEKIFSFFIELQYIIVPKTVSATYQQTSYHQQAFGQNLPANSHQLKKEEAEQYQSFDILAPNVIVPEKETTYWCSVHKLPDFVNSVHGVGFESFILKSSNDIIHHIEVHLAIFFNYTS